MAYGGGTWQTQNKVLPGTYINFASTTLASSALSQRGIAALPLPLSWGQEGGVFEVTNEDFPKNSLSLFGYPSSAPEMLPLRELFLNARTAYLYRLSGTTVKATCTVGTDLVATALYGGARGNSLRLVIAVNVDDATLFDVSLYLDNTQVETQSGVKTTGDLAVSKYVTYTPGMTLSATAGTLFTGGDDGTVDGASHQSALDKLESYAFNTLGCVADDASTQALYAAYTKRMRSEVGAMFQLVGWHISDADFEGVISVENEIAANTSVGAAGLVYWVLGAEAACEVNKSVTNKAYDGGLTILADYTQTQLAAALLAGKFMFHVAGGEMRVLSDVNTLLTLTEDKGDMFQKNQTIRVCDQIANDTAVMFNLRYTGKVTNNDAGRISLWAEIVALFRALEQIEAISDFDTESVAVEQGAKKGAVLFTLSGINIANAMEQLYMAVYIV